MEQIRLLGGRKLRSSLKRAGLDVDDLKAAHAAAAKYVEEVAVTRAPVVTGTLLATLRSSGSKTKATVRAGNAKVPYAGPIHWGWPDRNISPNTFITDAAQSSEGQWSQIYMDALDKIISQIEGK